MSAMISFNEFKKGREKGIKERYELFKWIKEKEQKYNIESIVPQDFNTITLYRNATFSFFNQCFLASILTISTAIEQFLLWEVEKTSKLKERLYRKELRPKFRKIVSQSLLQEFDDFNERCRDEVAHPKTRSHFSALGLPYNMEEGYFGNPDAKPIKIHIDSKSFQSKIGYECAKEGLELFMKIVSYVKKTKHQ